MDIAEFVTMAEGLAKATDQLQQLQQQVAEVFKQNEALIGAENRARNYHCLPDFLNMSELCKWFGVSYKTMKPFVDLPDFPKIPIGVGAEFRFPKEAVRQWFLKNANDARIYKLLHKIA